MEERLSYRPTLERMVKPGKASDFIHHFEDVAQPGCNVVLWCRESVKQNEKHLAYQDDDLRKEAQRRGANVVGAIHHVGPGFEVDSDFSARVSRNEAIGRAVSLARCHDAILLATEPDRFVRNPCFNKKLSAKPSAKKCQLQPFDDDFQELREATAGVVLATKLYPDASPSKARSQQTKRGRPASGKRVGRPLKRQPGYLKQRKEKLLPKILELSNAGLPLAAIAARTKVPRRTVSRWIAENR